ncbi:MAG: hypothetical protein KBF81_10310, partial [Aquabacterium sp.]|nr:hypothetical protein [Aquabacterium sp.]
MESHHLLLAFVVLTHTLTSGMWWAAGSWMGLSSRAAHCWMIASLSNGLGLCLLLSPSLASSELRVLAACA